MKTLISILEPFPVLPARLVRATGNATATCRVTHGILALCITMGAPLLLAPGLLAASECYNVQVECEQETLARCAMSSMCNNVQVQCRTKTQKCLDQPKDVSPPTPPSPPLIMQPEIHVVPVACPSSSTEQLEISVEPLTKVVEQLGTSIDHLQESHKLAHHPKSPPPACPAPSEAQLQELKQEIGSLELSVAGLKLPINEQGSKIANNISNMASDIKESSVAMKSSLEHINVNVQSLSEKLRPPSERIEIVDARSKPLDRWMSILPNLLGVIVCMIIIFIFIAILFMFFFMQIRLSKKVVDSLDDPNLLRRKNMVDTVDKLNNQFIGELADNVNKLNSKLVKRLADRLDTLLQKLEKELGEREGQGR